MYFTQIRFEKVALDVLNEKLTRFDVEIVVGEERLRASFPRRYPASELVVIVLKRHVFDLQTRPVEHLRPGFVRRVFEVGNWLLVGLVRCHLYPGVVEAYAPDRNRLGRNSHTWVGT